MAAGADEEEEGEEEGGSVVASARDGVARPTVCVRSARTAKRSFF